MSIKLITLGELQHLIGTFEDLIAVTRYDDEPIKLPSDLVSQIDEAYNLLVAIQAKDDEPLPEEFIYD